MGQYFAIILVILTIASGVVSLIDILFFAKARAAVVKAQPDFAGLNKKAKKERLKAPLVADYARSLFPVFLIVLCVRSFIVEPFRVPTGSMLPTIQLNDFLLINKFAYGVRLPIIDKVIIPVGTPQRGDIMVFHYPVYTGVDYIKTVVGLPGDKISYLNKKLYINGELAPEQFVQNTIEPNNSNLSAIDPSGTVSATVVQEYQQTIGDHTHTIYNSPIAPAVDFKNLVVPAGEYFMMGDNRDNSDDSRFWGFVPAKDIVGKAFLIWMSWDSNTDSVRWHRLGSLLP
jgi:signal peptidase I